MSSEKKSTQCLSVMLVDDTPSRAALLEQALTDHGYQVVCRLQSAAGLVAQVDKYRPDVVIMDIDSPDRDTIEHMSIINRHNPLPIILFAGDGDSTSIERAVHAGVSAYVVGGASPERVKPIMDVAIARFREYQALRQELEETRNELADRKLIDKAKRLVMMQKKIDETRAYELMRKTAMQKNIRLVDVAKNIIAVLEMLE
jgi:two-component system, response regulator / RNA-binding antiterminator